MGIRVRKLARELHRSPGDLLGLLQQLGYERYRTPEDMVSDSVAARLRQANRPNRPNGHAAAPKVAAAAARPRARMAEGGGGADLMAQLVPGVKPASRPDAPRPAPAARDVDRAAPAATQPGPTAAAGPLSAERERLQAWQCRLQEEQEEIVGQREAVAAERAELAEERSRLRAEREGLDAERAVAALSQARLSPPDEGIQDGTSSGASSSMLDMFDGRGLKGIDEAERALAALAGAKALGRLLEHVKVREPDVLRRLLWERLVLVGGSDVPEELDVPSVVVSQDRADIPGSVELSRRCAALGEQLMLSGLTRVTLVGIARRWQSVLRARMDGRIEMGFRPSPLAPQAVAPSRDPRRVSVRARAGEMGPGVSSPGDPPSSSAGPGPQEPVDAILVWAEEPVDPAVRETVGASRTRLFAISAPDLATWLEQVALAIANDP